METWKGIKNLEKYEVSSEGRVRSLKCGKIIIRKLSLDHGGYPCLTISLSGEKDKGFSVHRLVAEAFCKKPKSKEKLQVDHINYNIEDNRVKNLRWVTPEENLNNYNPNKIYLTQKEIKKVILLFRKLLFREGYNENKIINNLKN